MPTTRRAIHGAATEKHAVERDPVERVAEGYMVLPRYMNVPACAAYLQRSRNAIYHLVKRAAIPHLKIGRRVQFDREKLDTWMKAHRRAG